MADIFTANADRNEVPAVAGISSNYTAGGMNFLQLLRRLRQECGVSGNDPASVTNLPGEMARLANYIRQAWVEIQTLHEDWLFMKQPVRFNTSVGQQLYAANEMMISSFGSLRQDAFSMHSLNAPGDEGYLVPLEFDQFRHMYLFGAGRTLTGRPRHLTVNSQGDMLLGPIPDKQYTVHGEGYAMPTELTGADDRPACPPQFHMAIVFKAMMYYGMYEAAPEVLQAGADNFNKLIARMASHQLPAPSFGATLV